MPAVTKIEDLKVWRKARTLAAHVDEQCTIGKLARNFALVDQMRRSSISVVSNVAEGFEFGTPRMFRQHLRIAKGSLAELRTQLYLCGDRGYLGSELAESLRNETDEIARMMRALIHCQEASI